MTLFYQVDYALSSSPKDAPTSTPKFRRVNPLPYKQVYTIVDGIKGKGQYVGTYMPGVCTTMAGGRGEIKFYMDGDQEFPTINGTGTEDLLQRIVRFENQEKPSIRRIHEPLFWIVQVLKSDGLYQSQQRFGLYRGTFPDPIRFESDLRVTIQRLGWRSGSQVLAAYR